MSRYLRFAFLPSLLALALPLCGQTVATSGLVVFDNGNVELLRVRNDSVLVLGGATASLWDPLVSPAIEYANTAIAFGDNTDIHFLSNAYYPPPFPSSWRYKVGNRAAADYLMSYGTHYWRVAPTGVADAPISWLEAMNLSSTGNLGIGIGMAAAQARVQIHGTPTALSLSTGATSNNFGFGVHFRDVSTTFPYQSGVLMDMEGNSVIRVSHLQIGDKAAPVIQSDSGALRLKGQSGSEVMIGASTGNVGLRVEGTGLSTFGGSVSIAGDVQVNGNIAAKYQDVAEWVVSDADLSPGTVVVLGRERVNTVTAATEPFDTRVAGVVSEQPGLILGEAGVSKEMVATTGRVRVRVDASRQPIVIGDLLVTSGRTGVAMKSVPVDVGGIPLHRPGTILGKALEPLASGQGEILVLLSLQ